jgi:hypothetical protein
MMHRAVMSTLQFSGRGFASLNQTYARPSVFVIVTLVI